VALIKLGEGRPGSMLSGLVSFRSFPPFIVLLPDALRDLLQGG